MRGSPTSTLFPYTTLFRSRIASLVVLDTLRPSVQLPTCLGSLHGERHHLYLGAEDRKTTRMNSSDGNHAYAPSCLSKINPRRCGAPARGGANRIRPSATTE